MRCYIRYRSTQEPRQQRRTQSQQERCPAGSGVGTRAFHMGALIPARYVRGMNSKGNNSASISGAGRQLVLVVSFDLL